MDRLLARIAWLPRSGRPEVCSDAADQSMQWRLPLRDGAERTSAGRVRRSVHDLASLCATTSASAMIRPLDQASRAPEGTTLAACEHVPNAGGTVGQERDMSAVWPAEGVAR